MILLEQFFQALGLRIKDNEDKKSKIENDLQLMREEKNDLESSLKAATGKIQQNDKGMDFLRKFLVEIAHLIVTISQFSQKCFVNKSVKVISYLNKQLNQMPLINSKPNEGYIPITQHSATNPTSISSR